MQFSCCVNSRPVVCEVRDVFQLCERPPLSLQHRWQMISCCTLLGLQRAMSMYVHENVKLGCLHHPAAFHLAWPGTKPDGHGSLGHRPGRCCTIQHKFALRHLMPLSAALQASRCSFTATLMLVLLAGLLLHAAQCLGPEPASKGAAVCSLVRCNCGADIGAHIADANRYFIGL